MEERVFAERIWARRPHRFEVCPIAIDPQAYALDRVEEIIARMDSANLVCRRSDAPPGSRMERLAPEDVVGRLEKRLQDEALSIMLEDLHLWDPLTADLLGRFKDTLSAMISPVVLRHAAAALFITSPRGVSSYHDDREENFLCHLRGTKRMHVFPFARGSLAELAKATFGRRKGIFSQYRAEYEDQAQVFDLAPSDTLYVPRAWPHWVQNGPEISVSLSLHFFTPSEFWVERVYRANDKLRQLTGGMLKRSSPWR